MKPVVVEVPRQQLVAVSGELTAPVPMPAAPKPAYPSGPDCARPAGCYSNAQLDDMLSTALSVIGTYVDRLGSIRQLMNEALKPPPKEANNENR